MGDAFCNYNSEQDRKQQRHKDADRDDQHESPLCLRDGCKHYSSVGSNGSIDILNELCAQRFQWLDLILQPHA